MGKGMWPASDGTLTKDEQVRALQVLRDRANGNEGLTPDEARAANYAVHMLRIERNRLARRINALAEDDALAGKAQRISELAKSILTTTSLLVPSKVGLEPEPSATNLEVPVTEGPP